MIGVLGHGSALLGYTGPGTTWTNEIILLFFPGKAFSAGKDPGTEANTQGKK